jgi:hypothetical protein
MKTIRNILFMAVLFFVSACSEYLDVVPDNTMKLEDIFVQRSEAINALSKVYSYLPHIDDVNVSPFTLGDEYIGKLDFDDDSDRLKAMRIMRGLQSSSTPMLGLWSGGGSASGAKEPDLYEGIRQANIFLQYVDQVFDMSDTEKAEWKAQVIFLKAYYHFLLLQQYGPIAIVDNVIDPAETSKDVLFPKRAKIEECFDYIVNLMNEAIPKLRERVNQLDYGQVDQVAAKAIKARVLLFRASPFYNGSRDLFGDFYDHDGQPFFPITENKEKWKDALDAINDAIITCENNGLRLYSSNAIYKFDVEAFAVNPDRIKTLYDLRMVVVDPWNEELVWGLSNLYHYDDGGYVRHDEIAHAANIRLPNKAEYSGNGNAEKNSGFASGQWLGATYKMLERYYTKNGLPVDEDLTYESDKKYAFSTTPSVSEPAYNEIAGILQPGVEVPNLYMNRELRFYANLGITGGYYRSHRYRIKTMMYYGDEGGRSSSFAEDYLATGIGIQKMVHPESGSGWAFWQIRFPYPIVRMADLYLMKAEALNEYYDAPTSEVYEAINKVRRRAGIPDVEKVWSDPVLAKTVNKHTSKTGMRDIILQERGIELAFEGSRYWDMVRHKRAVTEFSGAVMGWNTMGSASRIFFVLGPVQSRRYTLTNYLWPIDLNEINTNSNLIQNPGW